MLFLDSFEMFINSTALLYIKCGENSYAFPEHKLIIHLVPLNSFTREGKSASEKIMCAEIAMPINSFLYDEAAGYEPLYLYEDRWLGGGATIRKRILAMIGQFRSVFARCCKVIGSDDFIELFATGRLPEKIAEKVCEFYDYNLFLVKSRGKEYRNGVMPKSVSATALNVYIRLISDFLNSNHSYGSSKCSFRYMLLYKEAIVAVATFSSHKILKRGAVSSVSDQFAVRSYEWVRYASLPDIRVVGGMGKLLKSFLREIISKQTILGRNAKDLSALPVEVMSYSDNEWSSGRVYERLGFTLVGERKPVEYYVNMQSYKRYNMRQFSLLMNTTYGNRGENSVIHEVKEVKDGRYVGEPEERRGGRHVDETGERQDERYIKEINGKDEKEAGKAGNRTLSGNFCKISNKGSRKFLLMLPNLL